MAIMTIKGLNKNDPMSDDPFNEGSPAGHGALEAALFGKLVSIPVPTVYDKIGSGEENHGELESKPGEKAS